MHRLGHLELLDIFYHIVLTDQTDDLGKGAVAGIGKGAFQRQLTVGFLAGDSVHAVLIGAGAGEGSVQDVRHAFQRCSRGNDLENGARNIGRLGEAVEIDAVVGAGGIVPDIRHIVGVIGRRGHSAEDLAGLIVVDADGPLPVPQGFQCGSLNICRQGQLRKAVGAAVGIQAVHHVVAGHLSGVVGDRRGADLALPVAQPVERRLADRLIVRVDPGGCQVQEHGARPVYHLAAADVGAVVNMGRTGRDHPLVCLSRVLIEEEAQAAHQDQDQQHNGRCPARYSIHPGPSFS